MKLKTRELYARRLEPVFDWMANHSQSEPDLYRLADLACLSPFHFHRVYKAMVGETVAATMQRFRLHHAAVALSKEQTSLGVVARRAGYVSDAAFNRVFAQAYGMPPGRYRATRLRPLNPQEFAMYPLQSIQFPGLVLAALPHQGAYESIGPVFSRVFMLAGSRGLATPDTPGYGVYLDDPEQVDTDRLRAYAGVPVDATAELGNELERFELPAAEYAVLTYTGPYHEIGQAYRWLYAHWLPQSGREPADFPMFEKYLNDPMHTPPAELITQIHMPLKA